jgi:hypothetical protein
MKKLGLNRPKGIPKKRANSYVVEQGRASGKSESLRAGRSSRSSLHG